MAELNVIQDERPGILKEIDDGAIDLIFQAIQEDIYSFPIKSFVRESISNGLDAIVEKNIFKKIESGVPVEKFYRQEDDGKLLKDSKYDPSYYNSKFLSKDDRVYVTYTERQGRHLIQIKDYGVGLSGSRLKGFFKLGYSSKRNMKDVIGKFGAGAKAGLATGVDYFIMHTVYNGYKSSFMVFKNDYEAITPETDETIEDVWTVKMQSGITQTRSIYWEPTKELNGVTIELEVKPHNKEKFISAVKNQFQYFNGRVHLKEVDILGDVKSNGLNAIPVYESDTLLIPEISTYLSPHILVDGISYGLISWDELELDRRTGKIAIKVRATDVDITQSRESLKWTEKTKKTILASVKRAKQEAEDYMAESLKVTNPENLFEINNKYSVIGRNSDDIVNKVFAEFLDMHNVVPRYNLRIPNYEDMNVYLNGFLFEALFYQFDVIRLEVDKNSKVQRTKLDNFTDMQNAKIIFGENKSVGPKLVGHLLDKFSVDSLIYIKHNTTRSKSTLEIAKKEYNAYDIKMFMRDIIMKYCTLNIDNYEVQYDETEEDLETKEISRNNFLAIERKRNQEVLYTYYNLHVGKGYWDEHIQFTPTRQRQTIKISNIEEHFRGYELVICTGTYQQLGRLLEMADAIEPRRNFLVIYVAQEVVHHFAPYGTVISDYFRQLNPKTNELVIGDHIRTLNTWNKAMEIAKEYPAFSRNYNLLYHLSGIDVKRLKNIADKCNGSSLREVVEFNDSNFSEGVRKDVMDYIEIIADFQDTIKTLDENSIKQKSLDLFKSEDIRHINAYDDDFIGTLKEEFERLKPIEPILRLIGYNETAYSDAVPLLNTLLTTLENKNDNI